jgi:hypothetical protein
MFVVMTFTRKTTLLAGAGLLLTAGLAACGSDGSGSSDSSGGAAAPRTPVSTVPADMMLTAEDAPSGFTWMNIADLFAGGDDTEATMSEIDSWNVGTTADPAQCAGLLVNNLELMSQLHANPETMAAAELTPQDAGGDAAGDRETVIDAVVTTGQGDGAVQLPDDPADCATFTQTTTTDLDEDGGSHVATFHAERSDGDIDGADSVHVVTVTGGEGAPEAFGSVPVVIGTVGPVGFRVSGTAGTDPQLLLGVAQSQVDRITGQG